MGVYVTRWEKLKKKFETDTQISRPKEAIVKALGVTIEKSSGITPVLKEIDAAIEKKQRLPLEKALNNLFKVRSSYASFLIKEQSLYQDDPVIWQGYKNFIMGIQKLEEDGAHEAKSLQEAKSTGPAVTWMGLEGDLKGTLEKAKKDFSSYPLQEIKNGMIKKADPALKAAKAYTEAAAHSNYAAAVKALQDFKVEACKCGDAANKQAGKETGKYKDALASYGKAMRDLGNAARVDAQIRNLQQAQAANV
jgi:hypothetical protein